MSVYIRPRVTSARIFFTVALADRASDLLVREVGRLREAVRVTRAARPFGVDAWVVLPDHLHAVWTLPAGDADYSARWSAIKARFTRSLFDEIETDGEAGGRPGFSPASSPTSPRYSLPAALPVVHSGRYAGLKPGLRLRKRERAIWQRRYWEHHIRDERDFEAHVRYCWGNPVKHGLAARPVDWPYSSIHRDIRLGRVDPEWSGTEDVGYFGE